MAKRSTKAARNKIEADYTRPILDFAAERAAADQDLKDSFLAAFAEFGQIGKASLMSGATRQNVTRWREVDPEFTRRLVDIKESRTDNVEDALYNIATDTEAPHGARVSAAKTYLEANRPEIYRPRQSDTRSGTPTINLILGIPSKPPEELSPGPGLSIDTKAS